MNKDKNSHFEYLQETLPFNNKLIVRLGLNRVNEPYLGTLGKLADVFLDMDPIEGNANPVNVLYDGDILIKKNHKLACKAISIAILNEPFKIFFFSRILSLYLRWQINTTQLYEAIGSVRLVMNIPYFIHAIKLMAGVQRTTQPVNTNEENQD